MVKANQSTKTPIISLRLEKTLRERFDSLCRQASVERGPAITNLIRYALRQDNHSVILKIISQKSEV